jgi:CheY-like chemotaxis protein
MQQCRAECVVFLLLSSIVCVSTNRYLKVSSGAEALKLLEAAGSQPPHLVLLDAALPDTTDTTGLEVLQTIRQHFSQAVLPVIMLTARHNEKAIVQALDAGANDYAVKPFRRAELLARIRMHLRSSQKAAAAAAAGQQASAGLGLEGEDGDEERLSAELQRSVSLQQMTSVPLLVVQLGGVSDALSGASAEQACQLMGFIADCFDALVEKYAVLKVGDLLLLAGVLVCGGELARAGMDRAGLAMCLHADAAC